MAPSDGCKRQPQSCSLAGMLQAFSVTCSKSWISIFYLSQLNGLIFETYNLQHKAVLSFSYVTGWCILGKAPVGLSC